MKRFLLSLLCAIVSFSAMAEGPKRLINIDPATFRPVQKDALTGVNIDAIGKDRSQRPCARIKLHINRMSREDIDQLVVYPIGGNIELTRKMTSYEGNGLIIEMTAKQPTRFFIRHEKYGDSNEVSLNLEGNKEYFLEGYLELQLSIAVATNVVGADVFVDKDYKGVTDENGLLTIEEVLAGKHLIMIKHGTIIDEREVEVSSSRISFRLTINNNPVVASAPNGTASSSAISAQLIVPEVKTYKVGDYYNENGKEGVVFWVDETGRHGKIVSLTESISPLSWSSDKYEQKRWIGANDKGDGTKNMAVIMQITDWKMKYPAFKWCADLGEGWYLPANDELRLLTLDDAVHDVINKTLAVKGTKISNPRDCKCYWSSTEYDKSSANHAWMSNCGIGGTKKCYNFFVYVRAVAAF